MSIFFCYSEEFYNGCMYRITENNEVIITNFFDESVIIPTNINGKPVIDIEPGAINRPKKIILENNHPVFYIENNILYNRNDNSLVSSFSNASTIFIPQGVQRIRRGAFSSLELENIIIPDSVTEIDDFAFNGCWNLDVIHLSKYVKHIGKCAFPKDCKITLYGNPYFKILDGFLIEVENGKLITSYSDKQEVIIPNEIKIIGGYSFSYHKQLKSVIIPSEVIIEPWAFQQNYTLQKIVFKNENSVIGEYAFYECKSLQEIIFPRNLTKIEDDCFCNCNSLTKLDLPIELTEIGDSAFSNCKNLNEIIIHSKVKKIGECSIPSNTNIVLNKNFYFYIKDGLLLDISGKNIIWCSNEVERINIPNTVDNICFGVFSNCFNLKEILIPESVLMIWSDFPKNTLIKCKENSAAHEWCINNKHIFEIVE